MPDPIAVAFVEVRPAVDEFKGTTERELERQVGTVDVPGQLRIEGLRETRADVTALTGDLQGLASQQLQFPGLEDAAVDAQALGTAVRDISTVSVRPQFEPLLADVARLRGEAEVLSERLAGIPSNVGFSVDAEGLSEAASGAEALGEAQATLGDTLGTSATAASALIAKYPQLAAGEQALARATAQEAAQVRAAAVEETKLLRLRSRRATSVGPLRLAGIGLGAGVGLFAATQALGALTDELRVTGNESTTFEGRMRNLGASLLSGDVVGAFKSLTNQAHDFSEAELRMIRNTPGAEAALQSLGKGADLLRSRLEALNGLSADPVPQFIDTAVARAQAAGDIGGEQRALEKAGDQIELAFDKVRDIGPRQRELAEQIRELQGRREQVLRELETDQPTGAQRLNLGIDLVGITEQLSDLRSQANELKGPVNAAYQRLSEALRENRERREQLRQEAAERRIGGLRQSFGDRALAAELAGAQAVRAAVLREEQQRLREIVNGEKVGTALWREAAAELRLVNRDLETVAQQIVDENTRHVQSMTAAFGLIEAREAAVGTDAGLTRTLEAEKATLTAEIPVLRALVAAKIVNESALTDAYNRIKEINGQLEAQQAALSAEQQRHTDAVKDKRDAGDQAFINSLAGPEQALRNQQAIEQTKAGLAGDIRVSNELQALYNRQIGQARKRIADAKLRTETIAGLQQELFTERQNETGLRRQQVSDRVSNREEALDLQIELASTNENRQKEIAAHRAKIAFLRERIDHTRRQSLDRQKLRVAIAKERAAIRDLLEEDETDKPQAGSATTLADLFTQQTAIGRGRSIDSQLLAPKAGDLTQPIENQVTAKLKAQAELTVQSPFDKADKVVSSQEKLTTAIERLTATIPNLTGSVLPGSSGPPPGTAEGLRYQAMARFWESRRGKQLAQETASA